MIKKYIVGLTALCTGMLLCSWGFKGHQTVAGIALRHLTPNTANVVAAYLQRQSISEVSTWADEIRDPQSAPWHYLNLPLGLSHEDFVKAVEESEDNVYTAILKTEATLQGQGSQEEKNTALKYLIHLVGDAHQPMHISGKEDKGGNTIQLQFDGKGTNLHSLWIAG